MVERALQKTVDGGWFGSWSGLEPHQFGESPIGSHLGLGSDQDLLLPALLDVLKLAGLPARPGTVRTAHPLVAIRSLLFRFLSLLALLLPGFLDGAGLCPGRKSLSSGPNMAFFFWLGRDPSLILLLFFHLNI